MFFDALWKINGRHLQMSICIKFTMGIGKEVKKGMNVDCDFGGNAVLELQFLHLYLISSARFYEHIFFRSLGSNVICMHHNI